MFRRILWIPLLLGFAVVVTAPRTSEAGWCWFWCNNDYTKTQYPIVLEHGFLGFQSILGILDYWYGIENHLEDDGATVYVTQVSPINSSVNRGEQLIAQLEEIRAIHGDPNLKFNLIGHSQGGLDVRYVAGVRPDLVASLSTIATPHVGVDLFDILGGTGDIPQGIIEFFGDVIGLLWQVLAGNENPNDAMAALSAFDPAAIAQFNADFPGGMPASYCGEGDAVTQSAAGPIRNYSWTGHSPMTNVFDILDPVFGLLSLLYDEDNDGLVEVCGSHFGDVLRDNYRMNHLDEINQMLGLVALFETNPKSVFRSHANRLKNAGL
jgi:triacylglycerol lipase